MEYYLRSALIAVGLMILQTTFVPFLSVEGFLPDLLLIWIVYFAIRRGQLDATVAGFAAGLLQDLLTMQFLGLAAFSKTIAGFTAGYFYNENNTEQTLSSYRFLLIILLCSAVHNITYFGIFLQGSEGMSIPTLMEYTIVTSLYTTAIGALPMFTFARKQGFAS
ncbi:MAG: rod shape-determining protein MreD [Bacteroidota bacterium]